MEQDQTYILVGFLVVLAILVVGVVFFAQGGGAERGGLDTTKRFTAKPGTTRAKAFALMSSQREATRERLDAAKINPEETSKPSIPVKSLSPVREEEGTEEDRLVREALNGLNPGAGVAKLEEALRQERAPGEAAKLHAALAALYEQGNPPDYARAAQALAEAARLAQGASQRRGVAEAHARMLVRQGQPEQAIVRIAAARAELAEAGAAAPNLDVLEGQLREARGEPDRAREIYERVTSAALAEDSDLSAEDSEAVRIAAMNLARMYRSAGADKEAQALALRLNRVLPAAQ